MPTDGRGRHQRVERSLARSTLLRSPELLIAELVFLNRLLTRMENIELSSLRKEKADERFGIRGRREC
jgi:hypothetical protein